MKILRRISIVNKYYNSMFIVWRHFYEFFFFRANLVKLAAPIHFNWFKQWTNFAANINTLLSTSSHNEYHTKKKRGKSRCFAAEFTGWQLPLFFVLLSKIRGNRGFKFGGTQDLRIFEKNINSGFEQIRLV